MHLELTIEEAIEAIGRPDIARYIEHGMKADHSMAIRVALSREGIRPMQVPRELVELRVKIQGAANTMMPPKPKKRKFSGLDKENVRTLQNFLNSFCVSAQKSARPNPATEALNKSWRTK